MTLINSGHLIWWLRRGFVVDEADARRDFGDDASSGTWLGWVLADVAAKRRVVDRCAAVLDNREAAPFERTLALTVLRELATAYADRDGYDETWRTG